MLVPDVADPEDTPSPIVPIILTPMVSEEERMEDEADGADGLDPSKPTEEDYTLATQSTSTLTTSRMRRRLPESNSEHRILVDNFHAIGDAST
ncbi:unnamed protein product [Lactuca saligna]|uniref:Uncharacterized protein n=1 Tax=Lactuca saligna TaxID=75948 RepID=A0AA35YZJ8_LACSI|nr:unnamed protein product [Lactuca saligna]